MEWVRSFACRLITKPKRCVKLLAGRARLLYSKKASVHTQAQENLLMLLCEPHPRLDTHSKSMEPDRYFVHGEKVRRHMRKPKCCKKLLAGRFGTVLSTKRGLNRSHEKNDETCWSLCNRIYISRFWGQAQTPRTQRWTCSHGETIKRFTTKPTSWTKLPQVSTSPNYLKLARQDMLVPIRNSIYVRGGTSMERTSGENILHDKNV